MGSEGYEKAVLHARDESTDYHRVRRYRRQVGSNEKREKIQQLQGTSRNHRIGNDLTLTHQSEKSAINRTISWILPFRYFFLFFFFNLEMDVMDNKNS